MNSNTKLKLLYILKMLHQETDENHKLTVNQIIERLNEYGIKAERKSIYSDIDLLTGYGFDILCEKGQSNKYFMVSRDFELPELKLLVDTILASRFITLKKSKELIKKLERLVSIHEAKELHRNLIISNRIKSKNENIYYNVDIINTAINENKKVKFKYFDYNIESGICYRHQGEMYEVSPYTLMWNDENYYLVAYHNRYNSISNFRVDRMDTLEILEEERYTEGVKLPFDEANYSKKIFRMFSGDLVQVKLEFDNDLLNVVYDRFGHDVSLHKSNDDKFVINVEVIMSDTFLSWIFMFGEKVRVLSPEHVKQELISKAEKLILLY